MGVLDGKSAVVTGGGRGIGRGHCLHLARAGARVVVNDIDIGEAQKVVQEIAAEGGVAIASAADGSTPAGAEELAGQCVGAFGRIDCLVANAGIVRDRTFLNMSLEEFTAVWRVHVVGTFLCGQQAARRMREQGTGGCIITTTSSAHMGNFGQANYSAAKGAIASMTYTMALELARYRIRVNCISPTGSTRLTATIPAAAGMPQHGFIDPTLNGPAVVFLCSDDANWITGQVFRTGSDRFALMAQTRFLEGESRPGGWTLEEIRATFKETWGPRLEPFGLFKTPYPYYGGVGPLPKA